MQFATGATLNNSGTITGGNGGAAGTTTGGPAGAAGAGAEGVIGSGITVVTSGSITGGLGGDGVTRANAISFTGGANTLTLQTGASFTGNIDVQAGSLTFLQPTTQTLSTVVTGGGAVIKDGAGTLILTGANTYTGGTTVTGGTLQGNTTSLQGNIVNNATVVFDQASTGTYAGDLSGTGGVTKQGVCTLTLTGNNTFGGGLAINQGILAAANVTSLGGGTLSFNGGTLQALGTLGLTNPITLNSGGGTIDTNGNNVIASGVISGAGGLTKIGNGILNFQTAMTYGGGTTINAGTLFLDSVGGMLPTGGALTVNGGLLDMSDPSVGQSVGALAGTGGQISLGANNLTTNSSASTTLATQITGTGALIKQGSGVLTLTGNNLYSGGTQIQGGLINFASALNFGTGNILLNGGGLQWATGTTTDISAKLAPLGAGGGIFDTNGNNVALASVISGAGALIKQGLGTLTLTANNLYSGGTTVSGGLINFSSAGNFGSGAITLNGGGLQWAAGSSADISSKLAPLGAGGGLFDTNGNTSPSPRPQRHGRPGQAGPGHAQPHRHQHLYGRHGGAGRHAGGERQRRRQRRGRPGRHAGRQRHDRRQCRERRHPGARQLDRHAQHQRQLHPGRRQHLPGRGQCRRPGRPHQCRRRGGDPGRHRAGAGPARQLRQQHDLHHRARHRRRLGHLLGRHQQLRLPDADAELRRQRRLPHPVARPDRLHAELPGADAQPEGGRRLPQPELRHGQRRLRRGAGGDRRPQHRTGPAGAEHDQRRALCRLRHHEHQQQHDVHERARPADGQRARRLRCRPAPGAGPGLRDRELRRRGPLSAWASALGGLGSVLGDTNASTLTYNFGGAAAGIDYRLDPRFLVGIGVGYTHGTQWVNSFMGQGWTDSVSVAAYGSFTQGGLYVDALAGYAYFNNQLQRQILIPGLQQRTATGSTGANQFLGQIEAGYKLASMRPPPPPSRRSGASRSRA